MEENKIPKIWVLSRWEMEHLQLLDKEGNELELPPHIIISITDPDDGLAKIKDRPSCKGITRLQFWDIDETTIRLLSEEQIKNFQRLFTEEDAKQIWNFVKPLAGEVDWILCHCQAGISRSAGVAAALSKHFSGSDEHWFKVKHPNRLVHKTLLKIIAEDEPKSDKLFWENE